MHMEEHIQNVQLLLPLPELILILSLHKYAAAILTH